MPFCLAHATFLQHLMVKDMPRRFSSSPMNLTFTHIANHAALRCTTDCQRSDWKIDVCSAIQFLTPSM